jgi:hypothetical protein
MGRVACWASPRIGLLYSIPPIVLAAELMAKRCMKYTGASRSWSSATGCPGRMLRSPKRRSATRRTSIWLRRNSAAVARSSHRFVRGSLANSGRASASEL